MPRKIRPMTEQQKVYIKMEINNCSKKEIYQALFGVDIDTATEKEIKSCTNTLYRWKQHPEYDKYWKQYWRTRWGKLTYQAMQVLEEGMNDTTLPWRRTQSANLAISYGSKTMNGDEAGVIKVQVTGLPELGSPEAPEADVDSGTT